MSIPAISRAKETPTTAPFWAGLREHRVKLLRCTECQRWYWPFSACVDHDNAPYFTNMKWQDASGRGSIFSLNVHTQQFTPVFPVPYVYAIVELDEGPMYPAQVLPADGQDVWGLKIGDEVEARFVDVDEDYTYLRFQAIGDDGQ